MSEGWLTAQPERLNRFIVPSKIQSRYARRRFIAGEAKSAFLQ
jgi:hypothetical protein